MNFWEVDQFVKRWFINSISIHLSPQDFQLWIGKAAPKQTVVLTQASVPPALSQSSVSPSVPLMLSQTSVPLVLSQTHVSHMLSQTSVPPMLSQTSVPPVLCSGSPALS